MITSEYNMYIFTYLLSQYDIITTSAFEDDDDMNA